MRITDTFIDFTVENCEKINKHWLFRKKFMTFYCHGGDESVDIGTFATGQELYDAINQYCNQYNCTPANVELECNGYNDEILKIYNFEGALDGIKIDFRSDLRKFFANSFVGHFIAVVMPNQFLLDCGIPNLPIVVRPTRLKDKIKQHSITKDIIKNLNTAINAPLIVFKSLTYSGSFNIILEKENSEGLLCVSLHPNKIIQKNEVTEIASIHGRNLDQLINWCESNALINFNKVKTKKVFSGSQFNSAKSEYLLSLLDNANIEKKSTNQQKNNELGDITMRFFSPIQNYYKGYKILQEPSGKYSIYTKRGHLITIDSVDDAIQRIDAIPMNENGIAEWGHWWVYESDLFDEKDTLTPTNTTEPKTVSDLREKYNDRLLAFDNDNDYTFYGQDAEIISELFDIKISNGKCSVNKDFINRNLHKILKNNRIAFVDKITSFKQNGNYQTFRFAQELSTRYLAGEKYDWTHAQKLAKELKIEATNQELMQACELAVVLTARKLASENLSIAERFQSMRDLYDQQVTVQPLDTKGRRLQQYSTPCPLAFLLGEYVKNAKSDSNRYLEPSAGNGMLTIALPPENTIVNELDEIRVANLKTLGFERVTQGDARELPATPIYKGIITNPPFAIVDKPETRNSWTLNALDYILTAHALDSMADNGRAAIIVGGKMWGDYWKPLSERSEKKVLYGKWKWFVGYLYAQYNVIDVIYVDSHGIYNKQGTTYPIVIILIDGRHQYNEDNKPNYVFDTDRDVIINNYQQLFERIVPHIQPQPAQVDDKSKRARALMLKIKMAKAKI